MKTNISEQMEMLLWKAAAQNNGKISMQMAEQMYSTKSSAKSAVQKLELLNYIERTSPGYWKISKLPQELKDNLEEEKIEA